MERMQHDEQIDYEMVMKHTRLLRLMLDLDFSRDTMLRVVKVVNEASDLSVYAEKADRYICLFESCQTEADAIRKLDEAGL